MFMYGNICSALTTEPRDGCLRKLVRMKSSWPHTCFKVFRPYMPGQGKNMSRKGGGVPSKKFFLQTQGYNDLEAFGEKCCYFWSRSKVKFLNEGGGGGGCTNACLQCMYGNTLSAFTT